MVIVIVDFIVIGSRIVVYGGCIFRIEKLVLIIFFIKIVIFFKILEMIILVMFNFNVLFYRLMEMFFYILDWKIYIFLLFSVYIMMIWK